MKGGGEVNGVKAGVASPGQTLVYACDNGCGFEAKSYAECEQHGALCCMLKHGLQMSHRQARARSMNTPPCASIVRHALSLSSFSVPVLRALSLCGKIFPIDAERECSMVYGARHGARRPEQRLSSSTTPQPKATGRTNLLPSPQVSKAHEPARCDQRACVSALLFTRICAAC